MKDSYDVVVVGSGFGGAIVSCRLAEAGRSVCILERGKRWAKTDFPRSPGEIAKATWRENESHGFLEYRAFKRIDVLQGCGVGGGSLHYFNVHLRTPAVIFEQEVWPDEITRSVMDVYYELAEKMLESKPLEPPEGRAIPKRTQMFLKAARATGREGRLVPIGVYTGPNRNNPVSGIPQSGCDYSGNCLLGCVLHSKGTLDLNYIPAAEKHGAEVYPLHEVTRIEPSGDGGYRIRFDQLDEEDPSRRTPRSVTGRKVVVAAGTLGSNQLLLRCRDVHRSLPGISPTLGTRFSGNGDFLLSAAFEADEEVDPARGPSITAGVSFSTAEHEIFIEDLGFPEPFIWLLEGAVPTTNRRTNLLRAIKTYVLDGARLRTGRVEFEANRLFQGGVTTRMLPFLGMGTDAADGRLRLKNGSIDIVWSHRNSRMMYRQMEEGLKELSRGIKGRYVSGLLWHWPLRKLLTAHPLGGCYMGRSADDSVVNHQGEVWGYPNLYVADGALIPSALSVNPSLTISALAERVAHWMIHGREL